MRTEAPRPYAPNDGLIIAVLGSVLCVVLAVGCVIVEAGTWLTTGRWVANPPGAVFDMLLGVGAPWSWGMTVTTAVVAIIAAVLVAWFVRYRRRKKVMASSIDRKAELMGDPSDLSREAAEAAAVRGRLTDGTIPPGLYYGDAVMNGQQLWTNWRGTTVILAGPERGKTICFAVPFCMDAPGALIAMSNKRDLPDAIRGPRTALGTWWCFDPMRITGYDPAPTWWWNPLRDVTGPTEAIVLADLWANANVDPQATKSSFFDQRGPALLAGQLLAAALGNLQMPQVFKWLSKPSDLEPIDILEAHGFDQMATFMRGVYHSTGSERSGLFSTATNAVQFMVDPRVLQWVTDDGTTGRPEFSPYDFVRSDNDTLMLLSKKTKGSAAPLTAALTTMVTRAAEEYAQTCPHNRIPTPLTIVGDEIANVWRWEEVPDKCSFYGSLGVFLVPIFQNWSQGVKAYGKDGMTTLWEACTTRIVGGGLADEDFLGMVSKLTGEYSLTKRSAMFGGMGQMTVAPEKERILDVDELQAMREHIVVLPAAGYAVLAKPVPWMGRPYAAAVRASIARYEP